MSYVLSRQAQHALNSIWDYYFAQGGTRLADRILSEIQTAILRLVESPGLGHMRPDLTDKLFKFYRVYSFFLIYDPASSPLYIARVYHGAQDIEQRMQTDDVT